ncbi:MAG: thioredoxin [Eubacterium sp.]|jgi:thioredoxin 1
MIKKVTGQEYEEILKEPVAVVDFSATWCGPCRMLAPVMEQVSEEPEFQGKVKFYNVDVDADQDRAAALGINSVPTVIIFKNGKAESAAVGFRPQEQISGWIRQNL